MRGVFLLAVGFVFLAGCGLAPQPIVPPYMGVTAEMQWEIQKLAHAADPSIDVKKILQGHRRDYRDLLEATGSKVEFSPEGEYPTINEVQELLNEMLEKKKLLEMYEDFELALPPWAQPLIDEYKAGDISPLREGLLARLLCLELM